MNQGTLAVDGFEARLVGVVLPMGLKLDTVDLKGVGLRLRGDPFAVSVSQPGDMAVTVGETALAAFLEKTAPGGLRGFRVAATGGKLIVEAVKSVVIAEVRATALCTLKIVDGRQLYVELESVDVLGGGGLTNMVRAQLDAINPILNASDLPVDALLTEVECDAGRVLLRGKIQPRQVS